MNTRNRHPHDTLQTALRSAFPIDARRLEVFAALILAMIQARSIVLYTLKTHVPLPGSLETRSQRLRRFVRFEFPDLLFARFALSFLPDGELHLILDRTNWKLGKQDINILLLSAVWDGFSLPLMWALLPPWGSSSQEVREALLTRFLECCPERPAMSLLADREFIGNTWFSFLDQHSIVPCIRLPATATIGTGKLPVCACFKKLQTGEIRWWYRPVVVYGVSLRLCATKNAAGDVLYLAYRGHASINLRRYAQRWQAENLHSYRIHPIPEHPEHHRMFVHLLKSGLFVTRSARMIPEHVRESSQFGISPQNTWLQSRRHRPDADGARVDPAYLRVSCLHLGLCNGPAPGQQAAHKTEDTRTPCGVRVPTGSRSSARSAAPPVACVLAGTSGPHAQF